MVASETRRWCGGRGRRYVDELVGRCGGREEEREKVIHWSAWFSLSRQTEVGRWMRSSRREVEDVDYESR